MTSQQGQRAIVVVGAGHAGVQVCAALRAEKCEERIVLVGSERELPYQRPPLSKAFLTRKASAESLLLRGEAFYRDNRIELLAGETLTEIDSARRRLALASGGSLEFSHLVLATGARARALQMPGAELEGIVSLRSLADATHLRERLEAARSVAIVGAGFIGLEVAATAAAMGRSVHVVELAPRVMARTVTAPVSDFYHQAHRALGSELHLGVSVAGFEGRAGKLCAVRLSDGTSLAADLAVVGVGAACDCAPAVAAGLGNVDGVRVDEHMATEAAGIWAVGDCTMHPNVFAGRPVRLESVQNANDQARVVAGNIVGKTLRYDAVPWFWSDQADLKLQIAGFPADADQLVTRGDVASRSFSVFGFRAGRLVAVESVNRPGDHMAARRILQQGIAVTPEQIADPSIELKSLLAEHNKSVGAKP